MPNCPVDDFTLVQETYEGVTIDRCPHCAGVWLDAGELETIQENQADDFVACPMTRWISSRARWAWRMLSARRHYPAPNASPI